MTSRHGGISRQRQNQQPRPSTEKAHQARENGTMGDGQISTIVQEVHSDYGSDVDIGSLQALSDYGSEIDPNEINDDTLFEDLLAKIAANAPKTVIYPSIEDQQALEGDNEGLAIATPDRPTLRWARSSPLHAKSASMEVEYDVPSRRAFSGK